jgi:hypothetical protein
MRVLLCNFPKKVFPIKKYLFDIQTEISQLSKEDNHSSYHK